MAQPVVSVIVPVRDAADDLRRLLLALAAQRDAPPFEVVVADDGSADEVVAACAAAAFPLRRVAVAPSGAPAAGPGAAPAAGPGAARDAAVAVAAGARLAFVDADCRPAPGWLAALTAALDGPGIVVQGPIVVPEGSDPTPLDRVLARAAPGPLFETANLGAWRDEVVAAGGFAGGVRPLGGKEMGEDVALGHRLRRAGARVRWAPEAVVEHPVQRRDWRSAAVERARSGAFCDLVRDWPALRGELLHRRLFLGADRPATLVATVALPLAARALARRRPRAAAVAALAALPYAATLERRTRPVPRARRPAIALGLAAGDLVATASLLAGSLRTRTPVL